MTSVSFQFLGLLQSTRVQTRAHPASCFGCAESFPGREVLGLWEWRGRKGQNCRESKVKPLCFPLRREAHRVVHLSAYRSWVCKCTLLLASPSAFPSTDRRLRRKRCHYPDSAFPGQVALKESGRSPPNQGYDLQLSSVLKHFFFPLCDNFKISIIIKKKKKSAAKRIPLVEVGDFAFDSN